MYVIGFLSLYDDPIKNAYTVDPVLKGHLWDKEKVIL